MKPIKFATRSLWIALIVLISGTLAAQSEQTLPKQRENIELIKTRYLTRQMQLTKEEARNFWPIYDEYQAAMQQLRSDRNQSIPESPEVFDAMTDAEINAMIDARLSHAEKTIGIRKKMIGDLREVLSPRKIAIFLRAEQQFNRELQQRIRERRQNSNIPGSE